MGGGRVGVGRVGGGSAFSVLVNCMGVLFTCANC